MKLKASVCVATSGLAVALGLSLVHSAQAQVRPPAEMSVSAAKTPPGATETPVTRTCVDFGVWESSRTTAHLDALMTQSESVPVKYLGEDVAYLYVAVRQGDLKYIESEMNLVRGDCAKVTLTAS
jgi:hypothetical protein